MANIVAHLRPGAHVVAVGLQWAAPRVSPVNLFVLPAALHSVTALDGLAQPWRLLRPHLAEFELHTALLGAVYLACGHCRG